MNDLTVPFSASTVGEEEISAMNDVWRSGWIVAGKITEAFEREFAEYVGVKHAIFTNSGTSALKIAYKILLEEGFTGISYPRNTFCATYSAAAELGLDIMPYDRGERPLANRVNMSYGGVKDETPCILEDSAHRIELNDPLVGPMRIYSFYVTKNMTTGAGGMFVTDDDATYERARLFWRDGLTTSTHDRLSGRVGYEVAAMSGGYDGNDVAAACGRVQLRRLPHLTARRNEIRDRYNAALGQVWEGNHLYPFTVGSEAAAYEWIGYLKTKGIQCGYHYPGTGWGSVSLPIFPDMTDEQVDYVARTIMERPL